MSDEKTAAEREYLSRYKREMHEVDLLLRCSTNDLTTQNARNAFDHLCKALVLHISHSESLWRELQQMKAREESRFAANPEHFFVVSADEINAMRDEKDRARHAYSLLHNELIAIKKRCDELIQQAQERGGA